MDFYLFINNEKGVHGVATIDRSFRGYIHAHPHGENYYLLRGLGILHVDGTNICMREGDRFFIKPNQKHAFISTGRKPAKLYFSFDSGPLEKIEYTYGFGSIRPRRLRISPRDGLDKIRVEESST